MGRRKSFYSNMVRLVISIMLMVSCTAAPPTTSFQSAPTPKLPDVPLLQSAPILLQPAGPKRPDGFGIQSHITYPPPECALPGALTLTSSEIDYRYYISGRYASGWSPSEVDGAPAYAQFSQGGAILEKDANGIWLREMSFTSVDGSGHAQSLSGVTSDPIAASLSRDFIATVPTLYFIDSTQYGSLLFLGGTMDLSYSASAHTLTVTVGGSGSMVTPTLTIYSGTSEFHGSAQFNVSLPTETLAISAKPTTIDIDQGQSTELTVTPAYCNKDWKLTIAGQALTPDLSGGLGCSWTQTGNGDKIVPWDGKCDDGRWMRPGTYTAVVSADPSLTESANITVTALGSTPTPTPTPTACNPTDPGCPLQCPAGQVCPPPQCLPGVNCPDPTPTPPEPTVSPTIPVPTVTPPEATPTPCLPGQVCPSPSPTTTPSSSATPTPTPSSTSTPVPTPTPTPSPGTIIFSTEGQVLDGVGTPEGFSVLANAGKKRVQDGGTFYVNSTCQEIVFVAKAELITETTVNISPPVVVRDAAGADKGFLGNFQVKGCCLATVFQDFHWDPIFGASFLPAGRYSAFVNYNGHLPANVVAIDRKIGSVQVSHRKVMKSADRNAVGCTQLSEENNQGFSDYNCSPIPNPLGKTYYFSKNNVKHIADHLADFNKISPTFNHVTELLKIATRGVTMEPQVPGKYTLTVPMEFPNCAVGEIKIVFNESGNIRSVYPEASQFSEYFK